MAIPISWPSSDDVEDSYRSLDLLLEQLRVTLHQILIHRRRQQDMSHVTLFRQRSMPVHGTTPPFEPVPNVPVHNHPRLPLPDLVPESSASDCEPSRRKTPTATPVAAATTTVSTWVQVGADLRQIADTFRADRASEQSSLDAKSSRLKDASLLSIICPALGRSIWTTVALLLGWGLFTRTR